PPAQEIPSLCSLLRRPRRVLPGLVRLARQVTAGAVRWLESVTSTQDEAHDLAARGAPHGTAVAARIQTDGRGTRGRRWESGIGGLWLSVVCRPQGDVALASTGLRIGLALADLIDTCLPPKA